MDFEPSETHLAVADLARKVLGDERPSRWQRLADAGLLGVAIPEAQGGAGHGLLELCALMTEAGRVAAAEPLWSTLAVGGLAVARLGTGEQMQRLLPGVVSGERRLTGALEASEGVAAEPDRGGWRLTGAVDFVPDAEGASHVLIPARGGGGQGVFIVEVAAPGLTRAARTTTAGQSQHRLELAGVRVPPQDLLGDRMDAGMAASWRDAATVALCALQLGVSEQALRMTARYTAQREQFGRPIATFQAVAQRAADAFIDVEAIRLTMLEAAWRIEEGLPAGDAVAIAKLWASEAGRRVGYAAQHLHGGIGFDLDYPLGAYFLLAKQIELTLGSGAVQAARLGKRLAEG